MQLYTCRILGEKRGLSLFQLSAEVMHILHAVRRIGERYWITFPLRCFAAFLWAYDGLTSERTFFRQSGTYRRHDVVWEESIGRGREGRAVSLYIRTFLVCTECGWRGCVVDLVAPLVPP